MTTTSDILSAARSLSSEQRAEVVYQLLLSLEPDGFDSDLDQMWAEEIERRRRDIREGKAVLRDWSEVLAELRAKFPVADAE